jgi:thioester reductase-like protein
MREVLRFSSTLSSKTLIYISTLATFFGARERIACGEEKSTAEFGADVVTGYAQTKWIAEKMALEHQIHGGDVLICHPGRLLGSLDIGRCPDNDLTIRLLSSIIETGLAPSLDWYIDFTPIDLCAKAMVNLASNSKRGIYHFIHPHPISLSKIVKQLNSSGYSVRIVPYYLWKKKLMQSEFLRPLCSLFMDPVDGDINGGLSLFETLLATTTFRTSSYEIRRLKAEVTRKDLLQFPTSSKLPS